MQEGCREYSRLQKSKAIRLFSKNEKKRKRCFFLVALLLRSNLEIIIMSLNPNQTSDTVGSKTHGEDLLKILFIIIKMKISL